MICYQHTLYMCMYVGVCVHVFVCYEENMYVCVPNKHININISIIMNNFSLFIQLCSVFISILFCCVTQYD